MGTARPWRPLLALVLMLCSWTPIAPIAAQAQDACSTYLTDPSDPNRYECFRQIRSAIRESLLAEGFDPRSSKESGLFTLSGMFLSDCLDLIVPSPQAFAHCQTWATNKALAQVYRLGPRDEDLVGTDPIGACLEAQSANPGLSIRSRLATCRQQQQQALRDVIAQRVNSPNPNERWTTGCALRFTDLRPDVITEQAFAICIDLLNVANPEQKCVELFQLNGIAGPEACSTIARGPAGNPSAAPAGPPSTGGPPAAAAGQPSTTPPSSSASVQRPPPSQGSSGGDLPDWVEPTFRELKQSARETGQEYTDAQWQRMHDCLVDQARQGKTREQALEGCYSVE